MEDRSDKALMKSIRHGSKPAFEVLFERYEHPLFNFILRYTGNRELAQDLLQETFIKVRTAAYTFDLIKGYFKGWIYTIALNTTRNELSKKQYAHHFFDVHEISGGFRDPGCSDHEHPDAQMENSDLQYLVTRALNRLPPLMKEVVIMKNYQQLKFWEIAEITAIPEGTLKARYHRAIGRFRELLKSRE